MKFLCVLVVSFVCVCDLQAFPNFVTNPYSLYPPGCATLPQQQAALYGENAVKFYEGKIFLSTAPSGERLPANLAAFRVACADAGRSIIRLAFSIPKGVSPLTFYETPKVFADLSEDWHIGMSLLREPGYWGAGVEPWYYPQVFGGYDDWSGETGYDKTWVFLLDNNSPSGPYTYTSGIMSAAQYNGSFRLRIEAASESGEDFFLNIPATSDSIEANPFIPLNGRLSGIWVVDGAPDQGFVITVSELPANRLPEPDEIADTRLVFFLSWFAFDGAGAPMWLAGNVDFTIGTSQVTIPIIRVINGELFGSKMAEREQVGTATISANNCNDLTFDYDLSAIGLGNGAEHLHRLYSMETAGYACRDLEARMQTMHP
jgi:hypothetical protein